MSEEKLPVHTITKGMYYTEMIQTIYRSEWNQMLNGTLLEFEFGVGKVKRKYYLSSAGIDKCIEEFAKKDESGKPVRLVKISADLFIPTQPDDQKVYYNKTVAPKLNFSPDEKPGVPPVVKDNYVYSNLPTEISKPELMPHSLDLDESKLQLSKSDDFNLWLDSVLDKIRKTLTMKGDEYTKSRSTFYALETGAKKMKITVPEYIDTLAEKHRTNVDMWVDDMKTEGENFQYPSFEKIIEKHIDPIVYDLLKFAWFSAQKYSKSK